LKLRLRSSETLFESCQATEERAFPAQDARFGKGIAQPLAAGPKFGQPQPNILDRKLEIFVSAFEMNRQLFAGFDCALVSLK